MSFLCFGLFFLMNLILATIFTNFKALAKTDRKNKLVFRRRAMRESYRLLDSEGGGEGGGEGEGEGAGPATVSRMRRGGGRVTMSHMRALVALLEEDYSHLPMSGGSKAAVLMRELQGTAQAAARRVQRKEDEAEDEAEAGGGKRGKGGRAKSGKGGKSGKSGGADAPTRSTAGALAGDGLPGIVTEAAFTHFWSQVQCSWSASHFWSQVQCS